MWVAGGGCGRELRGWWFYCGFVTYAHNTKHATIDVRWRGAICLCLAFRCCDLCAEYKACHDWNAHAVCNSS